jgi:hypothetical protein
VRIRCFQFVADSFLANDCESDSRFTSEQHPRIGWFDGDGCPSDDGLQVGGETIARGGNINRLTSIWLNRLGKTAGSRGGCVRSSSALVLQSTISSW